MSTRHVRALALLIATVLGAGSPRAATAEDVTARRSPTVVTVERVAPAVVNISTETLVRNPYYGRGTLFDLLFGQQEPSRERYVQNSLGSGVIVDPRGYVVTNEHVVAAASRITVTFLDGRQVAADFVGSAPGYDLAVLRLEAEGPFPHASIDFEGELLLGETVIAIGNPFGLESTVTTGVLSGTHRRVSSGGNDYTDFLQTDAAINPGNSGGALLTVTGDLIGINTQVDVRGQNLGFAIPVARVRKVFDELVRFGEVLPVWPGLVADSVDLLDPGFRRRLGAEGLDGLFVRQVLSSSPAARAGVRPGDVLVAVDGEAVRDHQELHTVLSRLVVGRDVAVDVWRPDGRHRLTMRAEPFPVERAAELAWRHLGLALADVPRSRRQSYVAIRDVRETSAADRVGLRRGLIVLGIDGRAVHRVQDFNRELVRGLSRGSVLLAISDGRGTYRVPLTLE